MKRIWLALVAAVGLLTTAGVSRADFGGPPVMQAGGPVAPQAAENTASRYGVLPFFRQVVWWKKAPTPGCVGAGCGNTGMGAPRVGGYAPPMAGGYGGPPPGYGQPQGTLVFPNHQFNRSPRDFFMWEK